MKLPRDISGEELARLLRKLGYEVIRQTGSHMRLLCAARGAEHRVTIPAHQQLKIGTLSAIVGDVAEYLGLERAEVLRQLFGG